MFREADATDLIRPFASIKHLCLEITDAREFDLFAEAVPPSVEELALIGSVTDDCAMNLATKLPNLTSLFIDADGGNISEEGLFALIGENNKLQSLTIRNLDNFEEQHVTKLSERCPHLQTLNLTHNINVWSEVTELLLPAFPNLKKLIIDPPTQYSEIFEQFTSSRPYVAVEYESIYLKDVQNPDTGAWYPAIQKKESRIEKAVWYHLYGTENIVKSSEKEPAVTAPIFSHKDNYGKQDFRHCLGPCYLCHQLQPLCKDMLFAGTRNLLCLADWYFDEQEGKQLLAKFAPQGPENRISYDVPLPDGISYENISRALVKIVEPETQTTLFFPQPLGDDFEPVFATALPVNPTAIEFGRNSEVDDATLKAITNAAKVPDLFYCQRLLMPQAKKITEKGWKKLKHLPNLEVLDVTGNTNLRDTSVDGLKSLAKLTDLNLAGTGLTDASIVDLAKNWSNLTHLNLRLLDITENSIEAICRYCPNLESLNLILCNHLPPSSCKLLQGKLPKLKELSVPFHWIGSESYNLLKSARPGITFTEKSELVDALQTLSQSWYPALIQEETANQYLIHFYGFASSYNEWIDKNSINLQPLFTHKDNYGKQKDGHFTQKCQCCQILHPLCQHIHFGTSKNRAFINDWFFDSEEGKSFFNLFTVQVKKNGILDFCILFPDGLDYERAVRKTVSVIPADLVERIALPAPLTPGLLAELLEGKPNLFSVTICGAFHDTHATLIANLGPNLARLTLINTHITDEGLKTISTKCTSLEYLCIKIGINITEKGLAGFHSIKSLDTIEIDLPNLTVDSVRLLAKLPGLASLMLPYFSPSEEVRQEIQMLEKQRKNVVQRNKYSLYDCQDTEGNWYPALVLESNQLKSVKVHYYGHNKTDYLWLKNDRMSAVFSHQKNYGPLNAKHMKENCELCKQLHIMCQDSLFAGERNAIYLY